MTHRRQKRALWWILAFAIVALAWAFGCKPNLPPAEDCRVGTQICRNEQGYQCAGTPTRYFPLGDYPCTYTGAVCAMVDGGAHCVTPDGGADADKE